MAPKKIDNTVREKCFESWSFEQKELASASTEYDSSEYTKYTRIVLSHRLSFEDVRMRKTIVDYNNNWAYGCPVTQS